MIFFLPLRLSQVSGHADSCQNLLSNPPPPPPPPLSHLFIHSRLVVLPPLPLLPTLPLKKEKKTLTMTHLGHTSMGQQQHTHTHTHVCMQTAITNFDLCRRDTHTHTHTFTHTHERTDKAHKQYRFVWKTAGTSPLSVLTHTSASFSWAKVDFSKCFWSHLIRLLLYRK